MTESDDRGLRHLEKDEEATCLGETVEDSPFTRTETLWRCNRCSGVFWYRNRTVLVGVVLIDVRRLLGIAGPDLDAEPSREESRRFQHNADLHSTYRDSEKCSCLRNGVNQPGIDDFGSASRPKDVE